MYATAIIELSGDIDPDDREYEIPPTELLELLCVGAQHLDTGHDLVAWLREKLENPQ